LSVIQQQISLTERFVNSFFKEAFYRAPWRRCVVAAAILSLANCTTSKTAYNRRPRARDTDEFYREQQEWVENRRSVEWPPEPPPPYVDEGENEGPAPDEPRTEPSPPPMDSYPQGTLPRADDIPTAKPGKNGIVESPFVPGKPVDIQGYPPGATVRDPYSNKIFIVPIPTPTPNH
jgi:hypothetical protein